MDAPPCFQCSIAGNSIGPEGAEHIATALEENAALQEIDLYGISGLWMIAKVCIRTHVGLQLGDICICPGQESWILFRIGRISSLIMWPVHCPCCAQRELSGCQMVPMHPSLHHWPKPRPSLQDYFLKTLCSPVNMASGLLFSLPMTFFRSAQNLFVFWHHIFIPPFNQGPN